jgi:hypothetical protein
VGGARLGGWWTGGARARSYLAALSTQALDAPLPCLGLGAGDLSSISYFYFIPISWGLGCSCSLGPPTFFASAIKHQMSSKEHIQLGWVARWVLSTPRRATPRLGSEIGIGGSAGSY